MEAEIEAAMQELDAAQAAPHPSHTPPANAASADRPIGTRGPRVVQAGREHRAGIVVSVGPADVFVEFGPKELGVVERTQWKEGDELPAAGSELSVVVNRYEPSESLFICSLPGSVQKADWELLQPGQVVEARVTGTNKGGLELEIAGHQAFMPASQVSLDHIKDLSVFVGEKMACQVQRIDRRGKGNIVLSRRDVMAEERKELASKLKETLAEGQTVEGIVRKIMPFGAFVDLGGIDGLIHVSDLTYDRVGQGEKAIARYITEGQKVTVQVLKVDWDAKRISLGMKQMQADPFATAMGEVVEGAQVSGRVTKITEFGAFVEIQPGVEGLVHISELDWRRVNSVDEVVQPDEVINAKVLKIDPDSRRISLSIKALKDAPARPEGGGRGKGRGRGDRDDRSPEEILKESPAYRRLKEGFGKQGFKGGLG